MVVVVLPDPFRGIGVWRNSMETQQSGHASRSGPEVKNGSSSAKDGAPDRLRCGTIQEEVSQILQRVSAGAARRILPFCIGKRTKEGCDPWQRSRDNSQRMRRGRASSSEETEVIWQERELYFVSTKSSEYV